MALHNDQDGWAPPRQHRAAPKRLHDYDMPTPQLKDTAFELVMNLAGIAGVFFLIIALVKIFAL